MGISGHIMPRDKRGAGPGSERVGIMIVNYRVWPGGFACSVSIGVTSSKSGIRVVRTLSESPNEIKDELLGIDTRDR